MRRLRTKAGAGVAQKGDFTGDPPSAALISPFAAVFYVGRISNIVRAGFKISVKFRRNFGIFFVFGSYREVEFR